MKNIHQYLAALLITVAGILTAGCGEQPSSAAPHSDRRAIEAHPIAEPAPARMDPAAESNPVRTTALRLEALLERTNRDFGGKNNEQAQVQNK